MTYNTKTKVAVIDFFKKNSEEWISAEQIMEREDISIKQSTLYRLLGELTESGCILKEYSSANSCCLYKFNKIECQSHFHIKCIECGKFVHIKDKKTEDLLCKIGEENEFLINKGKTVLYGKCNECRGIK